jgi:MFS family permease
MAGVVCLAAMVAIELKVLKPMLDLRLFADRMFRNASVAMFMTSGGLLGLIFLLALYLQQLRGLSAFDTGLAIFPLAIGMGVTAQVSSRIYPRVGPRRMIAFGLLLVTLTSAAFLGVDENTSLWWIRGIMLIRGVGMSFAMVSLQAATFATIAPPSMGRASSLSSTQRQVASAVGVALLATVLIERTASHLSDLGAGVTAEAAAHARLFGFQDAFLVLTVMGAIGFASAFLISDKDAEATLELRGAMRGPRGAPDTLREGGGFRGPPGREQGAPPGHGRSV